MAATFDVYEDTAGEYRWRLTAENNNIIADGGEGYATRSNALRAVDRITEVAPEARRLEFGRSHYEVYTDQAEKYRWRLLAENGQIIARSSQGYADKSGARRAVDRSKQYIDTPERFEQFVDKADEYRWRLKAPNGRVLADPGEGYSSEGNRTRALERVQAVGSTADRLGGEHFEVYEDQAGEHRWRLIAGNGRIIADGGEGYASKDGAIKAVDRVKEAATRVPTLEAPLGFTVATEDGPAFEEMIPAGTELPANVQRTDLMASADDQTQLELRVLYGGGSNPAENEHLGTATLTDLPAKPKDEAEFSVRYLLDPSGTLAVEVEEQDHGTVAEMTTTVPA